MRHNRHHLVKSSQRIKCTSVSDSYQSNNILKQDKVLNRVSTSNKFPTAEIAIPRSTSRSSCIVMKPSHFMDSVLFVNCI